MSRNDKIKRIVVLMLENRSFDHMLGFLKQEDPRVRGIVGDDFSNVSTADVRIPVSDGAAFQGQLVADPGHDVTDVYMQMYGVPFGTPVDSPNMSGFAQSYEQKGGKPEDIMKCFRPAQLPVITTLGRQYAICDQWFSSVPGPTLPNRAFAHFGTSFGRLDMSPEHFRAKPNIYSRLNKAGVKARIYYYASWSGTQGLTFLLSDQSQYFGLLGDFKSDCKNGKLPAYSFIEPAYSDHAGTLATDQHPDHNMQAGETFIREIYEAIRSNDDIWNSVLFLIVWDEHGGIFDHERPPMVSHPDGFTSTAPPFDFKQLGVRVPAVVVSPWIPAGTIDHTVYEHASIPATATEQFIGDPATASPYLREQFANTFLHLASLGDVRKDIPNFAPIPAPTAAAAAVPAPASSLHLNQVQEIHQVLTRNHPELAQQMDPGQVKTEADVAAFVDKALNVINPQPANSGSQTAQ